ncbi:ABC transporter permease [Aestuariimicrobium soli]|uniref:ABC transporter permease n=1 Tax=Aestuariimicrobium soli TaxID=2035834 RepID=UPI003EBC9AAC
MSTTTTSPGSHAGFLTPRQRTLALLGFARNALREGLAYRADLVMSMISQVVQVVLLMVVWRSVYGSATTVSGISREQAVSYAVLASSMQTVMMPWAFSGLYERVRTGQVGVDMTRPVGLVPQLLAQNLGTMLARLPVAATGVVAALVIGAIRVPPAPWSLGLWAVSAVLGLALGMVLNLLMSMISFWSLEITGWMMIYRFGSAVLSGSLIPLWFMPGWLRSILEWLPFQGQMFTPLVIFFGRTSWPNALELMGVQVAWIAGCSALLWLVWRAAQTKVVVQGG